MAVAAASSATKPKPKPWQWTKSRAATKLTAMGPTTFGAGEIGNTVFGNVCRGLGRGVLSAKGGRHYTRFACTFRLGGSNGSYSRGVILRTLPIGSGKLCLDVKASAGYIFDAAQQAARNLFPITERDITDPSRICP